MTEQIRIRGRTFTLRSDQEENLGELAAYVERRIAAVAERAPRMDDTAHAILAALNIASELQHHREDVREGLGDLDRELAAARDLLTAEAHPRED